MLNKLIPILLIFPLSSVVLAKPDCDAGNTVHDKAWFDHCFEPASASSQTAESKERGLCEEVKTRGLLSDEVCDSPKPVHKAHPIVLEHKQSASYTEVSFELLYDYNSAVLTDQAKEQLTGFVENLKDRGVPQVKIVGHTDAVGDEAYNVKLSRERAESVKKYLVDRFGYASGNILTEGVGKAGSIEGTDPFSEKNRRVAFFVASSSKSQAK